MLPLLAFLLTLAPADDEILWQDAAPLTVEGRGWNDTPTPFSRLPARAQGKVPADVWGLASHSAGLCIRFVADAPTVAVRWSVTQEGLAMPHMPATGVSGVDLYVREETGGGWRFVQNGRPERRENNAMRAGLPGRGDRECLLYLPLYNGAAKVEIGVPKGSRLVAAAARPEAKRRPVVVYGTSIVQGGCASRPGLAWPAILGRALDRPVINLGFSGSGKLEPEVSALLAELDPALYVIDCLWNIAVLPDDEIARRIETLVATVRKAHPATPLLFVGQSHIGRGAHPTKLTRLQEATVRNLQAAGVAGLHLAGADPLMGGDGEGTVDGVHPNDLGMWRQAVALEPAVAALLR